MAVNATYLTLYRGTGSCESAQALANQKIVELDEKLATLSDGGPRTEVRVDGLAALVTVALAAVWSGRLDGTLTWPLVMLGGLLYGLFTTARRSWARGPSSAAGAPG